MPGYGKPMRGTGNMQADFQYPGESTTRSRGEYADKADFK